MQTFYFLLILVGSKAQEHIPPQVRKKIGDLGNLNEQYEHELYEKKAQELRDLVASNPGDASLKQRLIVFLSKVGKAHESRGNKDAASKVLREILQIKPPPEIAQWDKFDKKQKIESSLHTSQSPKSCVAAPPIELLPLPLSTSKERELTELYPMLNTGLCPELDVSQMKKSTIRKFQKASLPLIVRGGAINKKNGVCKLDSKTMTDLAGEEIVKVAFPHRVINWTRSGNQVLDEVYSIHPVGQWMDRKKFKSPDSGRAILRSPTQWMRLKNFLSIVTNFSSALANEESYSGGLYLHQTSIPTQIPTLGGHTEPPKWARKGLGKSIDEYLWVSGGGTATAIHNDAFDNVHGVIRGAREMILFPPSSGIHGLEVVPMADIRPDATAKELISGSAYSRVMTSPVWAENIATRAYRNSTDLEGSAWPHGWKCSLEAGDAIFLPAFWYHAVHGSAGWQPPRACHRPRSSSGSARADSDVTSESAFADDNLCMSLAVNWFFETSITRDESRKLWAHSGDPANTVERSHHSHVEL
mmetsp:Transcript_53283/g.72794  ORF Transcript_53283/g.72794 Transcript_53283/m.72794 type:complete len:529 (-) Transcript_53283:258-1844(-)